MTDAVKRIEERLHTAEASLKRSEESFRLLSASTRDYAIFMIDTEGRVSTWNDGAQRIKGYAADEIVGRHFSLFHPEDELRSGKWERETEIARREGRFEDDGWRVRKDGTAFWANVVLTALRAQGAQGELGEIVGFAQVTRDLTERRLAEETRQRLAQVEDASRMKDELIATVSHELRTPLNAILGWSTILSNRGADPEVARAAATIRRNAQLQTRIVEDVLDVARIVTGQLRIDAKTVSLSKIVRDVIDVVCSAADAKRIIISTGELVDPALVLGDASRLQQVVWNLLANALNFSDTGGSIHVELEAKSAELALSVRDTGKGISPESLPHVFERFRRAENAPTRRTGGLGLGLAIVRHLVELHGGRVQAESPGLDRGATFSVILPAQEPQARTPHEGAPFAAPDPEVRLEGLRILVVEDEPDTRELLQVILEEEGAKVATAGSAAAAREALARRLPHVIVSDIGMPGEDGYELLRGIRALPAEKGGTIPAIALTAYAQPEDRQRAFASGFDEHVAKPIDPEALLRVVQKLGQACNQRPVRS